MATNAPFPGDKVVVQDSLLYTGRFGTLQEIAQEDQKHNLAGWDFLVELDDGRIIGVDADQVRKQDEENVQ